MADEYTNECEIANPAGISGQDKLYQKYRHCLMDCTKCNEIALLKKILYELRKLNRNK